MIIEGQGSRNRARNRKNRSDISDSSGSKLIDLMAPNCDMPEIAVLTAH